MREDEDKPLGSRVFDYEAHEREVRKEIADQEAARDAFLRKLMPGPDLLSWVVPTGDIVPDEILAEHLAQLRNAVRYVLQYAMGDGLMVPTRMSAASTAQRMIQTNIALAKALKAPASANSKTVRGVRRRKDPQD